MSISKSVGRVVSESYKRPPNYDLAVILIDKNNVRTDLKPQWMILWTQHRCPELAAHPPKSKIELSEELARRKYFMWQNAWESSDGEHVKGQTK